jgi:hypothetical protein
MCPTVSLVVCRIPDTVRTCVRYTDPVGTWQDPDLGRPIAAPLERRAELVDIGLAAVQEVADHVEAYLRVDGTEVWSPMRLERHLRPDADGRARGGSLARRRPQASRTQRR